MPLAIASCVTDKHTFAATPEMITGALATAWALKLTLVSAKTGARFTYQIRRDKRNRGGITTPMLRYVDVLTGADNTRDFTFIGTVYAAAEPQLFRWSAASPIGRDAPSVVALTWAWPRLFTVIPADLEVWLAARCVHCRRLLTVPTSIAQGMGDDCASKG